MFDQVRELTDDKEPPMNGHIEALAAKAAEAHSRLSAALQYSANSIEREGPLSPAIDAATAELHNAVFAAAALQGKSMAELRAKATMIALVDNEAGSEMPGPLVGGVAELARSLVVDLLATAPQSKCSTTSTEKSTSDIGLALSADAEFQEIDRLTKAYLPLAIRANEMQASDPEFAKVSAEAVESWQTLARMRDEIESRGGCSATDLAKLAHIALAASHFDPEGVLDSANDRECGAIVKWALNMHRQSVAAMSAA